MIERRTDVFSGGLIPAAATMVMVAGSFFLGGAVESARPRSRSSPW
jgi:hypothetical protein